MMSLNKCYVRIRLMKSRTIKWVGQVSHVGRGEVRTGFWWISQREIDNLECLFLAASIILKWILRKSVWRAWIELIWFRIGGKWRALFNLVMNLWIPQNAGNIFIS
jgi:hypothetical protein